MERYLHRHCRNRIPSVIEIVVRYFGLATKFDIKNIFVLQMIVTLNNNTNNNNNDNNNKINLFAVLYLRSSNLDRNTYCINCNFKLFL